jgi:hypothetical protein
MATHRCIPLESADEWREALIGIRHAFAHTWESCHAMHLTTGFPTYLYCFEDGETRIVCPISERQYAGYVDIVTPYGLSGFTGNHDCPDFPRHWKRFASDRGYVCGYIQLNPLLEKDSYVDANEVYRYHSVYVLDLTRGLDEIVARFDRGRRQQIRAISGRSSSIILDRQALTRFLLEQTSGFFRRRNASPFYQFTEATLSSLTTAENVSLIGAGTHDVVEAVAMAAYTPYIGEAFLQVSASGGKHHAVEMVWHRLTFLKSRQIPWMSLGGGVTDGDGVALFKARFGTMKLGLGCLKQIYNPSIYAALCRQRGEDPNDLGGYFPPYHNPRARESAHV